MDQRKQITLKDLDDDWTIPVVSMVDDPAVDKARFFALKNKEMRMEQGMHKIREVRKRRNLSIAEVSEATNISRGNLSQYETGGRALGPNAAKRLGDALGMKPEELIYTNRFAVAAKAKDEEDVPTLLQSLRAAIQASEEVDLSESAEERLAELLADALELAEDPNADEEEEEEEPEKPPKKKGKGSKKSREGNALSGLLPGRAPTPGASKGFNGDDTGRDAFGRRLHDPEDEDPDEDDLDGVTDDALPVRDLRGKRIK